MKKYLLPLSVVLFGFAATKVSAQTLSGPEAEQIVTGSKTVTMSSLTGSPSFIVLKDENSVPAYGVAQWLKTALKAEGANDFGMYQNTKDELGWDLQRYHQTYNGVPVEGAVYITHIKNGILISANG